MLVGLNAGFGETLAHEFPELERMGVQTVRQGLSVPGDRGGLFSHPEAIVAEFRHVHLLPLFLCEQPADISYAPAGSWVEFINEPDLKMSAAAYAKLFSTAYDIAKRKSIRLFGGGISNLNDRGFAFLARFMGLCPYVENISIHRYSQPSRILRKQSWSRPHHGFLTRTAEVAKLKILTRGRPFIVTEVGFHTAPQGWYPFRRRLSHAQQYNMIRKEFQFWSDAGAEAVYLYQLNDGLTDAPVDNYGIRDKDGQWKTARYAFRLW